MIQIQKRIDTALCKIFTCKTFSTFSEQRKNGRETYAIVHHVAGVHAESSSMGRVLVISSAFVGARTSNDAVESSKVREMNESIEKLCTRV